MKKILFLSMGLLAAMAFSPPTLAVDTGPEMGSDKYSINSAPVPASTNDIAYMAVGDEASNDFAFITSGRETLVHRPDHTVGTNHYLLSPVLKMTVNSALAVDDRQRPCNSMIMNGTVNLDLSKNTTGLAAATAAPANTSRHSMAWVTSYLSGSDLRG